jgi:hypothetical protein
MEESTKIVIEKIQKLLKLSESPNENEAQSALAKAHALLAKHNLKASDLNIKSNDIKPVTLVVGKRLPTWHKTLIAELCHYNNCKSFFNISLFERRIVIIGKHVNVVCVQNMFNYLNQTIKRISKGLGESFRMGVVARIADKLKEQQNEIEKKNQKWGLVIRKNTKALDEWFRFHGIFKTAKYTYTIQDRSGFSEGYAAGGRIGLDKQMNGTSKPAGYLKGV